MEGGLTFITSEFEVIKTLTRLQPP